MAILVLSGGLMAGGHRGSAGMRIRKQAYELTLEDLEQHPIGNVR